MGINPLRIRVWTLKIKLSFEFYHIKSNDMKLNKSIYNNLPIIVSYLYILLFVYAAVSKIIDFQNFQVQLGQSPLLGAFAGFISYTVIAFELLIALLLSYSRTRNIGIHLACILMVLFTLYIFIVLNYSTFIPCSCGGVLESMSWQTHLWFNIIFVILAWVSLNVIYKYNRKINFRVIAIILTSSIFMFGLYLASDNIIYKRNNFVRRFPPFPTKRVDVKDLKFNSYYFAGKDEKNVYLGNHSAPALIVVLDTTLTVANNYNIKITDTLFDFHNIQLRVSPPYFFLFDGTVPCVFRGNLNDSIALLQTTEIPGFTKAVVIDSSTLAIRTLSEKRENLLSTIDIHTGQVKKSAPNLLQKQIDGLFDTDGTLQYSSKQEKLVYLYYYRNEYTVTDYELNLLKRGNTIDTTSRAKIKMEYVESRKERKFSAPPFLVNRISAIHNNLLFVNSMLPGRYDEIKMWKNANVIDVYDILTKTYVMSFYIYKIDGDKIDDLIVTNSHLFVLIGSNLVSYKLSESLQSKYKN